MFDLDEKLRARGVDAEFLQSRESPIGAAYLSPNNIPEGEISMNIPISRAINYNLKYEERYKPQYRLIIFPRTFINTGAGRQYEIEYELWDIKNNSLAWKFLYSGSHMSIFSNSENSVKRSKKITDAVILSLLEHGLIN